MEHMEHRMTAVEDRAKSNTRRLEELERRQDDMEELVSSVKVLAVRQETVESDVKEIKNDVKTLAAKPARRYDAAVDHICWALISALAAFLLARLGIQ